MRAVSSRRHSAHEPSSGFFERVKDVVLHVLNHNERLLLILWYAEKMSPAEIARTLDLTEQQAVRLHRLVLDKLRVVGN